VMLDQSEDASSNRNKSENIHLCGESLQEVTA